MLYPKKKRKETVDIVGDLVPLLDYTVDLNAVVDNADGSYTLYTCNTKYLRPCSIFTYDAVEYTVIDNLDTEDLDGKRFIPNEKFTVTGASLPAVGTITLDPMKYFHGTVIATANELTRKELDTDKFPMFYLLEIIRDNFNNNVEDRLDRETNIRLFALINTDEENWFTDDHYRLAIIPMRNMTYAFVDLLNDNENIGDIDNYTAINHARFGVYTADKGHTKRIFNDKSSGVELVIDLPIKQGKLCLVCN